jgi:hypothetical protein
MGVMRLLPYLSSLVLAIGCGGSNNDTTADASGGTDSGSGSDTLADASTLSPVIFTYSPSWSGVVGVDVIGGFNLDSDWTTPLMTLTASGNSFTGTAMLPPGTYPYLFHIVGDADAGGMAATYARYSIDPTLTSYIQCPAGSPTAGNDPNPCSQMAVPQETPPTPYHVTGTVVKSGTAVAKYLVVIEREEAMSHHFFVDRMTTTGSGTFDFIVAPGQYRIQVQHPQYESKKDSQLDPDTLGIARRNISTSFPVAAADVAVGSSEVAFANYTTFLPRTTATLPTTFTFPTGISAKLDVYGYATEIGDPWYAAPTAVTTGTVSWDGTFNTPKANQTAVDNTHTYYWGVEVMTPVLSGVKWTIQSLVFPISWPTQT